MGRKLKDRFVGTQIVILADKRIGTDVPETAFVGMGSQEGDPGGIDEIVV